MTDLGTQSVSALAPAGPPVPASGALLAGRYRLEEPRAVGPHATLWRARDEVLARPVAAKVLHRADGPGAVDPAVFLAAATRAGRIASPFVANVFDAAVEDGAAYVVSEWLDGMALGDVLRAGPLANDRAAAVVRQVAEGLAAVHDNGVAHGRLHPGNVLVTAAGLCKITDVAVAFVVAGLPAPDQPAALDIEAVGALLYAALTARWPAGDGHGLPGAPYQDGRLCSPRQVRAGVSRELDGLTMRALEPTRFPPKVDTPRELLAALGTDDVPLDDLVPGRRPHGDVLPSAPAPADAAGLGGLPRRRATRPVGASRPPMWRKAMVPAVFVGVIATGGLLGSVWGTIPLPGIPRQPAVVTTGPTPDKPPPTLSLSGMRDFDPEGDKQEGSNRVGLARDGDPGTWWETEKYSRPDLGGLKSGVGLLVDLQQPKTVSQVTVNFLGGGNVARLLAGDNEPSRADDLAQVGADSDGGETATFRVPKGTSHRYWLVWVTQLASYQDGYKARVADVTFTP